MADFFKDRVERYPYDIGTLVLRLCVGAMMIPHGFEKLERFFSPAEITFPDPFVMSPFLSLTFATFAEFVCAIFVVIGYRTRFAAIVIAFTMAVAVITIHIAESSDKYELPMLYLVTFSCIFFLGGGQYSIDYRMNQKRKREYYF